MTTKTQEERILAHLKSGISLTPFQALTDFGCFRLSARIHALRGQGHKIERTMKHQNGKYFAEYFMS